jgi:hypothetical protein
VHAACETAHATLRRVAASLEGLAAKNGA